MKKLFLAISLSLLCFGSVAHAVTTKDEQFILMKRAEKTATQEFEKMETYCEAANKKAESYDESIKYQIDANNNLTEALKSKTKETLEGYANTTEYFTAVTTSARSAQSLCTGTKQLILSDKNYDSAFTKNIIMRIGDGLTNANESRLASIFRGNLIRTINRILGAIAILYIVVIGMKYIFARGEDEDMTRYKKQFLWLILGLVVISLAEFIGFDLFDPSGRDILSADTQVQLSDKVKEIVRFMEYAVGAFILITAAITGYQLVMIGGGEEAESLEKKFFKSILLGCSMILMSEVVVRILSFGDSPEKTTDIFISEVAGIVNFALSFVAISAAGMLVLASVYFVISFGNEEQTSTAKSMIKTSIIGIIIASASYVLVRFLVP